MKLTRFKDVPQFAPPGNWECNYDLKGAWEAIERWRSETTGPLNLDPDFQREHVWTEAQQVAWLEFLLRGGKSGRVIYFNHPGWMRSWEGEFVVIDGKQRLESIRRLLHDEIRVFGSLYSEFTDSVRMMDTTLRFNVNNLKTRAEVLSWYLSENTGGTPHTSEEIERVRGLLEKEKAK